MNIYADVRTWINTFRVPQPEPPRPDHHAEIKRLYCEIGRLSAEFARAKAGHRPTAHLYAALREARHGLMREQRRAGR